MLLKPGTNEERYARWLKDGKRLARLNIAQLVHQIRVFHPETAADILKSSEPKDRSYDLMGPWLGEELLTSAGKRWARDRRLLTRGFHFDILRGYLPVYNEAVGVMLDQWAEVSRHDGEQTINVSQCSKLLTLDVILRCIMSYESHCQTENAGKDVLEYVEAVLGAAQALLKRYYNPHQHFDLIFPLTANGRQFYRCRAICHRLSQRLIAERRKALSGLGHQASGVEAEEMIKKKTSRKYLDFLDILLTVRDEDGNGLSDKEIQEQVDTFLFEGHDTTASALQWTLYYLAAHPDLQEKCRQEVQGCLDKNKELSYESLTKLQYLTQFVKESMRLSGTVPYIGRRLTKPMEIDGHLLPVGTEITISILGIHRHPDVWDKPLEFDPDRFSLENSAKRHPYAFVPFSAGPRNCIGQQLAMDELKTVISLALLRFRLTLKADYVKPPIYAFMVSRPLEDLQICAHEIV